MKKEINFELINKVKSILMWGGGYHTEEVLRFYKPFFNSKKLFITDQNKVGETIEEYKISAANDIDYNSIDLVVIMSAIYHDEIENTLRNKCHYKGNTIGLYAFRQALLEVDSYDECLCHINDFIYHMENGTKSYSYDSVFKQEFSHYKKIKLFAWLASSIGESIRYLLTYYDTVFKNKPEDEYYLLVPYIKGDDFANGKFIEIISRTIPLVTYQNCHFWKYLLNKYPKRFDCEAYNNYNGILVDSYDQFDKKMPDCYLRDMIIPVISYTQDEENCAVHELELMGVTGDFVCIFGRDSAFEKQQYGNVYNEDIRNIDMQLFKNANEYLSGKNIKTVRMGKTVANSSDLPNCIDYASKYRSDLMDLYLLGNCKFYAGSLSGIVEIAHLQNVPTVLLGVVQIGIYNSLLYRKEDIYVPKKLYSIKENRILSFTEMWDAEMAAKERRTRYYQDNGLEFIECTQEEIAEAVAEMNEKIDGTYIESDEEKKLQKKYHNLLDSWIKKHGYKYAYYLHSNISGTFILKNAFLLEEYNQIQ